MSIDERTNIKKQQFLYGCDVMWLVTKWKPKRKKSFVVSFDRNVHKTIYAYGDIICFDVLCILGCCHSFRYITIFSLAFAFALTLHCQYRCSAIFFVYILYRLWHKLLFFLTTGTKYGVRYAQINATILKFYLLMKIDFRLVVHSKIGLQLILHEYILPYAVCLI